MTIDEVRAWLAESDPGVEIEAEADDRSIVTLSGDCETYQQLVDIGHGVARLPGVRNVVSDMTVGGEALPRRDYGPLIERGRTAGKLAECDVVVVGMGIVGCAIARELSRLDLDIIAIDIAEDVACGASKSNNGGVHHAGGVKPGTLKARLSVQGNRMWDELADDLGFEFNRCGDLLYVEDPEDVDELANEFKTAVKNGDWRPKLIDGAQCLEIEPRLALYGKKPVMGLWLPSQGRVHTYEAAIAMAENAAQNGVRVMLETAACAVETRDGAVTGLLTDRGLISCRYVVNAAGLYSDKFHNQAGGAPMKIIPRRGDYFLLDRTTGGFVKNTIFQLPGKYGKGVLVSPTVHGNTIVGPTAIDIEDKEATATTQAGLDEVREKSGIAVKNLPLRQVITSFAGLRAHEARHEFFIGEVKPGFVDCAAIESPGLSSSPAIGKMVAGIVEGILHLEKDPTFDPTRKGILDPKTLSPEEHAALIKKNPAYGTVICRCETVTEGEILDAIHRVPGARSLDGVKRRTRAGMGRCQAGFCSPRVMEILARELGVDQSEITKAGGKSKLIVGTNKDKV